MKKILIISFISLFISSSAFSQEDKQIQYLFQGNEKITVSGFGGPIVEFSSINNEFALFVGGGGAVLFNHAFFVGGYGEGLTTGHYRYDLKDELGIPAPKIAFGHGGFWLGYIHKPLNAVHAGISSKIGWGQVSLYDPYFSYDPHDYRARDGVFVFIPQLEVELNLFPWFKVNVGAGYRLVSGLNKTYKDPKRGDYVQYYQNSDFSSFEGSISFLFGWF